MKARKRAAGTRTRNAANQADGSNKGKRAVSDKENDQADVNSSSRGKRTFSPPPPHSSQKKSKNAAAADDDDDFVVDLEVIDLAKPHDHDNDNVNATVDDGGKESSSSLNSNFVIEAPPLPPILNKSPEVQPPSESPVSLKPDPTFTSSNQKAQVLAFLETQAHKQLEEINRHEQVLMEALNRQLDVELRKIPKYIRQMKVCDFDPSFLDGSAGSNSSSSIGGGKHSYGRDSTIFRWREAAETGGRKYSTRSSMRISMMSGTDSTPADTRISLMYQPSSNPAGPTENNVNLELQLVNNNHDDDSNDGGSGDKAKSQVVRLEGLGMVKDSDRAQVKSQLENLRSQLDSLLSSLNQ